MTTTTYVPVSDASGQPLAPCHPKRARQLLDQGKAVPHWKWNLFTIRLMNKIVPAQAIDRVATIGVDPGAEHTGIAVYRQDEAGHRTVLLALQIDHRGKDIKKRMEQRRNYRRTRRYRLRYRAPRFLNRRRIPGWLAPSVKSRLDNAACWIARLAQLIAVQDIAVETAQFDAQRLRDRNIQGQEYQQGPLYQTTLRAYIYRRDNRRCQYCSHKPTRSNSLTLDHIIPRASGGANTPDNIVAACRKCNSAKGDTPVEQFLSRKPSVLAGILAQLKKPLASAAHINVIIPSLLRQLRQLGWQVTEYDAAHTAANRQLHGIAKSHTNDAAVLGNCAVISNLSEPVRFRAIGHGRRQRVMLWKNGKHRSSAWPAYCRDRDLGRPWPALPPSHKQRQVRFPDANGISTGDLVEITNKNGTHTGYAMIYSKGTRITLRTADHDITGKAATARIIRRNHGYAKQNAFVNTTWQAATAALNPPQRSKPT